MDYGWRGKPPFSPTIRDMQLGSTTPDTANCGRERRALRLHRRGISHRPAPRSRASPSSRRSPGLLSGTRAHLWTHHPTTPHLHAARTVPQHTYGHDARASRARFLKPATCCRTGQTQHTAACGTSACAPYDVAAHAFYTLFTAAFVRGLSYFSRYLHCLPPYPNHLTHRRPGTVELFKSQVSSIMGHRQDGTHLGPRHGPPCFP